MKFLPMVHSSCLKVVVRWSSNFLGVAGSLGSACTISTIISLTSVISLLAASAGTEEDESQLSLRRQPPYYNAELYKVLRQHYKFQDFLWAGSGEGPIPSENQDGMAWEDDDGDFSGQVQIKVTKTMVLYKTVLSTIYPVAMTPVIVTSRISATPSIQMTIIDPSSAFSLDLNSQHTTISPTATTSLYSIMVQPTVTPSTPSQSTYTEHPNVTEEETSESLNDRLSASATDPRYWIQSSIKRKRENKYHPNDLPFQEMLQKRLAEIYATAFKRQLLKSLRLMGQHNNGTLTMMRNRRSTRRTASTNTKFDYDEDAETNPLYFYLRGQSPIARTAMNVSVSMINVTYSEPDPRIDLKYIVYAEGTPVLGFVAVKELQVMSKVEMEKTLEHEIIEKAKALVQAPEKSEIGSVASTTPWLIALMALVCLMIVILALTLFMAWKWRHNRLRDRNDQFITNSGETPHPSSSAPGGQSVLVSTKERFASESRRSATRSPSSAVFRVEQDDHGGRGGGESSAPRPPRRNSGRGIEETDDNLEGSPSDKSSGSMLINPSEGSSYNSHSPQRRHNKSKHSGVARKVNRQRRSRRRKTNIGFADEEAQTTPVRTPQDSIAATGDLNRTQQDEDEEDFSFKGDICRNMDKISFGNLEIYTDTDARPSSAQVKKILSRPSSHEAKKSQIDQSSTQKTSTDLHKEETSVEVHDRDRELSEHSFDVSESAETDKKDAEVQTPTRLKRRQSPRLRTSPRHRSSRGAKASKMSLISTESEEAVDFTNLPLSSSGEINPIGKIRKRFHQFLDDAFNVMAAGRRESPGKYPQSAKVTVTHQMKNKPAGRPWTSHVIREESVRKIRPKSSVVIGPPKPAWAAGSERRCQSAKSKTSIIEEEVQPEKSASRDELNAFVTSGEGREEDDEEEPSRMMSSGKSSSTLRTDVHHHSFSEASHSYIFPKYPTYPEVEVCFGGDQQRDKNNPTGLGTSHGQGGGSGRSASRLHPLDPAVPLIEAIKDEMKRFERVKVSSSSTQDLSRKKS